MSTTSTSEATVWVSDSTAEMPKIYIPDIPAQMTEEQIKQTEKK